MIILITGLPQSGKTTLAEAIKEKVNKAVVMDGDEIRKRYFRPLGFTKTDRGEHMIRAMYAAIGMAKRGSLPVLALIAPYEEHRDLVRRMAETVGLSLFVIYMDTPANECAGRDSKGMWAKAWAGEIQNFTGVDAPYEVPRNPSMVCHWYETIKSSVEEFLTICDLQS